MFFIYNGNGKTQQYKGKDILQYNFYTGNRGVLTELHAVAYYWCTDENRFMSFLLLAMEKT